MGTAADNQVGTALQQPSRHSFLPLSGLGCVLTTPMGKNNHEIGIGFQFHNAGEQGFNVRLLRVVPADQSYP